MVSIEKVEGVPTVGKSEPKYARFIPAIQEFIDADMDAAVVTDDEVDNPSRVSAFVRNAIYAMQAKGVGVHTRQGVVYLVKEDR